MESAATGKRERIFHNATARCPDAFLHTRKVTGVDHEQHAPGWPFHVLREAPADPPIEEAGVAVTVILKLPPEHSPVKRLGSAQVRHGEFDVIDLLLRLALVHAF